MNNIPSFLQSSENPANISLTVKGLFVMLVIAFLNWRGIIVDQSSVMSFVNAIVIVGSSVMTLWGIIRKINNATSK